MYLQNVDGDDMSLFTHDLAVSCRRLPWALLWAGVAFAQTKVDLSNQTKLIDLSNLGPTKPVQTGTVLPTTCSAGQLFFKTNAVPGANLYACVSTNTWIVFAGAGGSLSNSGFGAAGDLPVYLDNSGTQLVDSGVSGSPAVLMTQSLYQAGTQLDCKGQGGDTGAAMSCLLNPVLGGYVLHMPLRFTPALANSGAFTLNINSLGATSVKSADCVTDPAGSYFQPGQAYLLTYNGTSFCEIHGGSTSLQPASPYWLLGTAYYLPFAFLATLPPASGWTATNFTGATFSTTGMGGVVQLQSASSRTNEALNLQVVPRAGTSRLIAAISAAGLSTASVFGACGIGVFNSTSNDGYVLMQQLKTASALLVDAGYSSPTVQTFTGNPILSSVGGVLYGRIDVVGSAVNLSYSTTGSPGSWIPVSSRTLGSTGMPASVDSWSFFAEPAGTSPVTCSLLSWNVL